MARVVMVCQPTEGGAAVHVASLVAALTRQGHEIEVHCPATHSLAATVTQRGARWRRLDLRREPDLMDLRTAWALRRDFSTADVVILHSSKAGAVGRLALLMMRRRSRPRSIFTPHGWSWLVGGWLRPLYVAVEILLAHVTDLIIAVSDADGVEGQRRLGHRANIVVIPNGVDLARFHGERPSYPEGSRQTVLVVGRLTHAKGQDLAIRALATLQRSDIRLILLGDGPDRTTLEQLAQDLDVVSRVEFLGSGDPRPLYLAASVVLVPSRWDACSLVVLEALASGAAVVSTDRVGAALSLRDHVQVVASLSPGAIGAAVVTLLDDPARRASLRERARSAITFQWTEAGSMAAHCRLVGQLVSQPGTQ
jgi:glycosyltransferase involved in cell wall biosynthesis